MKKTMDLEKMELINGGMDKIDSFCAGFGAAVGVYAVGIWANWWNPVGWSTGAAAVLIGGSCALYAIR
jgi:hypothetical protein